MAPADRHPAADLGEALLGRAHQYSFFQLLEQVRRLHGEDADACRPQPGRAPQLRLASHAGLGFPVADIHTAQRTASGYQLKTTFLGLQGTDSPLPGYYLDTLAHEQAHGNGLQPAFLDFFNHYLLTLLHRGWRKYRYGVRFSPGANDRFSAYVFSLIGLGNPTLRGDTPLPWSRLLSFAGIIATRSRAPSTVAGIIAHCFDLEQVSIRSFERRTVPIHRAQQVRLGRANGVLASSFRVGACSPSRNSTFCVEIHHLDQAQFRSFLPSGINFGRLRALIDVLLRDALAWNLELRLKRHELPPFQLCRQQGAHLGWTSFMEDRRAVHGPTAHLRGRA